MSFSLPQPDRREQRPFRVVLQQAEDSSLTHFRPTASLQITPTFRTSGLLRGLPAEEVKTLLLLLTYLTPNGMFLATVPQMAEAMHVSLGKMEQRLRRLQGFAWQGEPLLREQVRESGLRSYTPSAFLVAVEQAQPLATEKPLLPLPTTNRAAVIAHSRAAYAHPRAEVERQMAELNGWELPGTPPGQGGGTDLRSRLLRFGVSPEQTEELLAQHPVEEIQKQLDWLPYRNARKPAPLLIAAIENRYAEPMPARQRRLFDEAIQTPHTGTETADELLQEADVPVSIVPLVDGEALMLPPLPPSDSISSED